MQNLLKMSLEWNTCRVPKVTFASIPGRQTVGMCALFLLFWCQAALSFNPGLTATPSINDGNYTLSWSPAGSGRYQLFVRASGQSGATRLWTGSNSTTSYNITNQPDGVYEHWLTRRYAVCTGNGRRGGCQYYVDTSEPITVRVRSGPPPVLDPPEKQAAYKYQVRVGDINNDGRQDAHILRKTGDPDNGVIAEQIIQRLSTNEFVLLNANESELAEARLWPRRYKADVVSANLNLDDYADIVVRGLRNSNSQVLISSGVLYDPRASQIGEIDDETRRFIRDTKAFMNDTRYFDTAQFPDVDGYNIRIDLVVGTCVFFFGFPVCSDYNYELVDIDVSLEDLGLDGFLSGHSKLSPGGISINSVGAYYSPAVHAAAEPVISQQNISDLHAYTSEMNAAMQKLGPSLPDISGDPEILRCVFFCGGTIFSFGNGYTYVYWVDTWTPITIPGGFDDENYSREAYELAQEMEVFAHHYGAILSNPAVQRALERGIVWVIGALGVGVAVEEVLEKIEEIMENEEEYPPIDPGVLVAVEHIIGLFCVDFDDPQECITAIEDVLGEDIEENPFGLPPLISSTSMDPEDFDLDKLNAHFPILATITTRLADPDRVNCTYSKFSPPLNQTYYGRTSGPPGDTCIAAVKRRNAAHVASGNLPSFLPADLRDQISGVQGYPAIRGREQQLIDSWMHDGRSRADVANIIRGVAVTNPLACPFHLASNIAFGPLSDYTGLGNCP